jgi:hypothetical protein
MSALVGVDHGLQVRLSTLSHTADMLDKLGHSVASGRWRPHTKISDLLFHAER